MIKQALSAKNKLNRVSKGLTDSYINYGVFVSANNALTECDDMKEKIKKLKTSTVNQRFQSNYKTILLYCLKCKKKADSKNPESSKDKGKPMLL